MIILRILAVLLILAGIAGLVFGNLTYRDTTHEASFGPLNVSVTEKKSVNIPVWAGIAVFVGGVALLLVPKRT